MTLAGWVSKKSLFALTLSVTLLGAAKGAQADIGGPPPPPPAGYQNAEGLQNKLLHVDLRDVAAFEGKLFPDAQVVINSMKTEPAKYFPAGIDTNDANTAGKVFGVELYEKPVLSSDGSALLPIIALMKTPAGTLFRKYEVVVGGIPRAVLRVTQKDEYAAEQGQYSIQVSLIERKIILTDVLHGVKKVYPVAVGGLDVGGLTFHNDGKIHVMTPLFPAGHLDIKHDMTFETRCHPKNYHCLPFLPILTPKNNYVGIAFHILQEQTMVRGFLSHGCMRMRKKDLLELYAILSSAQKIPVVVANALSDPDDHPFPIENSKYEGVVNCADPGQTPTYCRKPIDPKHPDEEILVYMKTVKKPVPMKELLDQAKKPVQNSDLVMPEGLTEGHEQEVLL